MNNTNLEPVDVLKNTLLDCAAYLSGTQPKRSIMVTFSGVALVGLSPISAKPYSFALIGAFFIAFGLYIKPVYLSRFSPRFIFNYVFSV